MFSLLFFSPLAVLLSCRYTTAKIPLFRSISCSYVMIRSDLSLTQSGSTPGSLVKMKVMLRTSVRFIRWICFHNSSSIYFFFIETDSNLIFNINLIQSSNSFSWCIFHCSGHDKVFQLPWRVFYLQFDNNSCFLPYL